MADRFEYYITGQDGAYTLYTTVWKAQTFTPSVAHKITSVKLQLARTLLPGTITVSIRATSGGHPILPDLCSGTYDGDTLGAYPGAFVEITLGAGSDLEADTMYAIVIRAPSGDTSNFVLWAADGTSPTYAGGTYEHSINSGGSWTTDATRDFMFEDWGEAEAPPVVGRSFGYIIG